MDPNNTHEVIFWDNLYKLRPWLFSHRLTDRQSLLENIFESPAHGEV